MEPEEQAHPVSSGRDHQDRYRGHFSIGVGALSEAGRLTPGRPGAAHERHHQQAALVEENQRGP